MKKNITIFIAFILVTTNLTSRSATVTQKTDWQSCLHYQYDPLINQLNAQQNALDLEEKMKIIADFFKQESISDKKIVNIIHKDYNYLHSISKKNLKNKDSQKLHQIKQHATQIKEIYTFLKKHRLQFAAIRFHKQLQDRWNYFVCLINENQDIAQHMDDAGIQELGKAGLKILKNKIEKDLSFLEYYEKKLHTDWITLKLKNYVLKIDIIRLRNAVIFHPFYTGTNHKLLTAYPR